MTEAQENTKRLEEFFRKFYYDKLLEAVKDDKDSITVDFRDLEKFDPVLADILTKSPRDFFHWCYEAIFKIDLGTDKKITVRIDNFSDDEKIRIKD